MGQLERSLNRLYGIEQDRPAVQKYARAFVQAVTSGAVIAVAFLLLAFGRGLIETGVGSVLQWPVAILLVGVGLAVLFSYAPNRRQPAWPWLAFGAGVAVLLWTVATLLLALSFRLSSNFGETYGPLAGLVALQLWTFLSACTILYGGAVMAQLEAVRAGVAKPREERQKSPERVPAAAKSWQPRRDLARSQESSGSGPSDTRRFCAMAEKKTAKKTQGSAKRTTATKGFTAEERAAMRERAQELKAEAAKADGESALLAKIAEMKGSDRAMAKRLHAIIKDSAPVLSAKTWYGMPAYAKDGKIVCFFQSAEKFKSRYATLGFSDEANLDQGAMWPTSFALDKLTAAEEKKIAALVKKAVR